MLGGIKGALNSNADLTWVPADFLKQQKVSPWSDMPVWIPPRGEEAYAARIKIDRALGKGLTYRPLAETARDTFAWFKSQKPERQTKLRAGLAPEREKEVLAAWHAQAKK
jgi:2'-hydroxyisoflavone reductase